MAQGKKEEAEEVKAEVAAGNARIEELADEEEKEYEEEVKEENDGYSKHH